MKNKTLSVILYGAIIICITVMLILFSGKISGKTETEFEQAPVTDASFVPESVVKLSDENERLSEIINEDAEEIKGLKEEKSILQDKLSDFDALVKIVQLIENGDIDGAKNEFNAVEYDALDDNAKLIYNHLKKELE